jgi:integrase
LKRAGNRYAWDDRPGSYLVEWWEGQKRQLHKFRHTDATRLLESGCDIVTVQKLMGHRDLETTRRYLDPDEKAETQRRQAAT